MQTPRNGIQIMYIIDGKVAANTRYKNQAVIVLARCDRSCVYTFYCWRCTKNQGGGPCPTSSSRDQDWLTNKLSNSIRLTFNNTYIMEVV